MLPAATADLYRAQQRRVVATQLLVRREWDGMAGDYAGRWERVAPRVAVLLSAAMTGAAKDGAASVGAALDETGFPVDPDAEVVPEAFGRTASDGRPLASLAYGAVVRARTSPGADGGVSSGRRWLDMAVRTQVADAARGASGAAITARAGVGWVRMVNPPCCKDCALLAGKWFRYNEGFQRHPRCDCLHRPAHEREPASGYQDAIDTDQIHDLSLGERQALDEGADLGRVVNAGRAGRVSRNRMSTTELGVKGGARLTPDGIYRVSSSRDEAVQRLRDHGYLL